MRSAVVDLDSRQAVRLLREGRQVKDPEATPEGARWTFQGGVVLEINQADWYLWVEHAPPPDGVMA
jgi:hypothetical protein